MTRRSTHDQPAEDKGSNVRKPKLDHACDWRVAALRLASCVVATLRTDGKIGVGSGLVMKRVRGKTTLERWDKDFIEALAFIGVEVVDRPRARAPRPPSAPRSTRRTRAETA